MVANMSSRWASSILPPEKSIKASETGTSEIQPKCQFTIDFFRISVTSPAERFWGWRTGGSRNVHLFSTRRQLLEGADTRLSSRPEPLRTGSRGQAGNVWVVENCRAVQSCGLLTLSEKIQVICVDHSQLLKRRTAAVEETLRMPLHRPTGDLFRQRQWFCVLALKKFAAGADNEGQ